MTPKNKKTHQTKQSSPAIANKIKSEFIEKLKQKAYNKISENTTTANPENDETMIEKQKCEKHQINQGQQQNKIEEMCYSKKAQ